MAMATTLRDYLKSRGIAHETINHPRRVTSLEVAESAHVDGDCVAKAVLLHDGEGYMLAVLPCTHRLDLGRLRETVGQPVGLATEDEVEAVFGDCDPGAVPPVGDAYGIKKIMIDDSLAERPDVFFEGGDHRTLVRMSHDDFAMLMQNARHGRFSHHI